MRPIFTELVTKVKPNTNSVEVHPQPSNIRHPVDDVLVGASSLCPKCWICEQMGLEEVLYAKNYSSLHVINTSYKFQSEEL